MNALFYFTISKKKIQIVNLKYNYISNCLCLIYSTKLQFHTENYLLKNDLSVVYRILYL